MASTAVQESILTAQSVVKSYGGQPVLNGVSLSLHEGERVGLIGRNGSGKSTLLKLLAGVDLCDEGSIVRRRGLRVGYLTQECQLDLSQTIGEVLQGACGEILSLVREHDRVAEALAGQTLREEKRRELAERYEELHHAVEIAGGWNLAQDINRVSTALNLPPEERLLSTLSGGESRRVDIAATLLARPDVLLLDEPTNHIDTQSVEWIENFLREYRGGVLLVTHDRYFLDLITTRIVELENNRLFSFPGSYARFLEYKAHIVKVEDQTERSRQGILRRELEWIRRGPKARATKQKARIQRFDELSDSAGPKAPPDLRYKIPTPPRLGKDILEADDLGFTIDGRVLFEHFNIIFQKGMRVGISGLNGCGKTTLARCLMGLEENISGKVRIGETTQFLYVDQTHDDVNPEETVLEFVSKGAHDWDISGRRIHIPAYLETMLFDRDTVRGPMSNLSGGERNRVELAKKLLRGGNFIVLDEPTNDLDLPTLRVLEEAILAFDGCAILISHDRYFLNRLCTHLIAFDEHGMYFSAGNYDDYVLHRSGLPQASTKPKEAKPRAKPEASTQRLTYHDKQDLANMEKTIASAEGEVERLEEAIHVPGFYEGDHTHVRAVLAELSAAKEKVEGLYSRWEDLEARKNPKSV